MENEPSTDIFTESKEWEQDKTLELQNSRRTAWIIASISVIAAMIAICTIAVMLPLKKTELRIIRVDNTTGYVDVVETLIKQKSSYGEVVDRSNIANYIKWREGYARPLAEDFYRRVMLFSSPDIAKQYHKWFQPENPASPLNRYNNRATVEIAISSISFLSRQTAIVRYAKKVKKSGDLVSVTYWTATVAYTYKKLKIKESERLINPLGFLMTEYRKDRETKLEPTKEQEVLSPPSPRPAPQDNVIVTPIVPSIE